MASSDTKRTEITTMVFPIKSPNSYKPLPVTEAHMREIAPKKILGVPHAVVAGVCYCTASASLVLLNKHALASFNFTTPNALLLFQCAVAVVLVKLCEAFGMVRPLQPLRRSLVLLWFPATCIFVLMLGSGFYALQLMGIGMFSVWKQLANLTTALGDVFIFKRSYKWPVWTCMALMMASAVVGASTDSKFTWAGYTWQIINCLLTSAYALCLRNVMDHVPKHTTDGLKMDEFSMVYYNNLLSIPPILLLMAVFDEYRRLVHQPALGIPAFQMVAVLSGAIGFMISFSSLWFLSQTTATIYSLVGSLNKFPIATVGIIAFQEPTNAKNLASIVIGLSAGLVFTQYKSK